MKPNRKHRKLRITEADYMLANRRASRLLEIQEHGKPVPLRSVAHKSKKVYDRKKLKRTGINEDGCPFRYWYTDDVSIRRAAASSFAP